jgi:hypothetical protein
MLQTNNVDPKEGCNSTPIIEMLLRNWFVLENRWQEKEFIVPTPI